MAEKRMFSTKITDHDNFTTLPATAQALYLHLVMSADDDGFCDQTNASILKAHAKKKDLEELVRRKYLIRFKNGTIVVKHWGMQNTIRADRYHKTEHQEEKAQLCTKPNGSYTTEKTAELCEKAEVEEQPSGGRNGRQTADKPQPDDGRLVAEMRHNAAKPQPNGAETRQNASTGLGLGINNVSSGSNIARTRARAREEPAEPETDLERVMSFYLDKVNPTPSHMAIDSLKQYTNALGADIVLHALGIALDAHKTSWRYIQAILNRYEHDGLKTLADVIREEDEFAKRKEERNGGAGNAAEPRGHPVSKWDLEVNDLDGD